MKRKAIANVVHPLHWGKVTMIPYRLCFINPNTNQVDRERQIEAADDVDAVHAAGRSNHRPLELWCGSRKVRTFAAREPLHA